eukprot:g4133.t1
MGACEAKTATTSDEFLVETPGATTAATAVTGLQELFPDFIAQTSPYLHNQDVARLRSTCVEHNQALAATYLPSSSTETEIAVQTGDEPRTARRSRRRQKLDDQFAPNVATDLKHGLVIGCNTLIGPYGYISLSGPGMLTHQGRCFTFDHSADGFARGEGIGSIKLKVCEDSFEASGRVAMLIGCSVNQEKRKWNDQVAIATLCAFLYSFFCSSSRSITCYPFS